MPRTIRVTNRSQPTFPAIGASSATVTPKPSGVATGGSPPGKFAARPGSVKAAPVEWEYSRATPRMAKQ